MLARTTVGLTMRLTIVMVRRRRRIVIESAVPDATVAPEKGYVRDLGLCGWRKGMVIVDQFLQALLKDVGVDLGG